MRLKYKIEGKIPYSLFEKITFMIDYWNQSQHVNGKGIVINRFDLLDMVKFDLSLFVPKNSGYKIGRGGHHVWLAHHDERVLIIHEDLTTAEWKRMQDVLKK